MTVEQLEAWHDEFDCAVLEGDIDHAVNRADSAAFLAAPATAAILELCNAPGSVIPTGYGQLGKAFYGPSLAESLTRRLA